MDPNNPTGLVKGGSATLKGKLTEVHGRGVYPFRNMTSHALREEECLGKGRSKNRNLPARLNSKAEELARLSSNKERSLQKVREPPN